MDRFWLLTWTTYGTWLPGDIRGSVTSVRDRPGPRHRHNIPGTDCDQSIPGLVRSAQAQMKGQSVYLHTSQAEVVFRQIQETTKFRGWKLLALAIMRNHVHTLIGVSGDPEPWQIMRDLKSYASRALNSKWTKPEGGTWWTESGSRRKLPNEAAVQAGIRYIQNQEHPLVVWVEEERERTG
jgi:REP element-mobilizing transposase RayT